MKLKNIFLTQICFLVVFWSVSLLAQTGWTILDSGTTVNLNALQLLDSHTLFVAGDVGTVLWSNDSGLTWQDISPDSTQVNLNDLSFFDNYHGLVVGDNGTILQTSNGGVS